MNRRSFIAKLLAFGPALAFVSTEKAVAQSLIRRSRSAAAPQETASKNTLANTAATWIPKGRRVPLMQGMTNQTSTQIIALTPCTESWRYEVLDASAKPIAFRIVDRVVKPNSKYAVERLLISDLEADQHYTLKIYLASSGELVDTRSFSGLDLTRPSVRLGLMSCMNDRHPGHGEMWREVLRLRPDALFFLGDNVYADSEDFPSSDDYVWGRYVETRLELDIFQAEHLIPTFAIWDDHDYAFDDGDRTFFLKNDVLRTFKAFFGSTDTAEYANGPGVASVLSGFGQRFVFLDGRSFRDPKTWQLGRRTQWGTEQKEWLFATLDPASTAPTWVFNGSQFFGRYHGYESVEREAPAELTEVLQQLGTLAAPVVLGSGDVHFSEVMRVEPKMLGYPSLEITSSAIHSPEADEPYKLNPRRIAVAPHNNFVIVESTAANARADINISIHGAKGAVYHTSSHSVAK